MGKRIEWRWHFWSGSPLAAEIIIPPLMPVENIKIFYKRLKIKGICPLNMKWKPWSPDEMATLILVSDAPQWKQKYDIAAHWKPDYNLHTNQTIEGKCQGRLRFQRKICVFRISQTETRWPMEIKFCMIDYFHKMTQCAKTLYVKYTPFEILLPYLALFYLTFFHEKLHRPHGCPPFRGLFSRLPG